MALRLESYCCVLDRIVVSDDRILVLKRQPFDVSPACHRSGIRVDLHGHFLRIDDKHVERALAPTAVGVITRLETTWRVRRARASPRLHQRRTPDRPVEVAVVGERIGPAIRVTGIDRVMHFA